MKPTAAISKCPNWQDALTEIAAQMPPPSRTSTSDLVFLFASASFEDEYSEIIAKAQSMTDARYLIGCSGQGIIGPEQEVEGQPALAILSLPLPGAFLRLVYLDQDDIQATNGPTNWQERMGVTPNEVNAWMLLADPFSIDAETLLNRLSEAYPNTPIVGGLASGNKQQRSTHLFVSGDAVDHGAIALAIGGTYTVRTVVSQGCAPLGETWTITKADGNIIETIAGKPAYEMLKSTMENLPPDMLRRAQRNMFVGLAMDEYQDNFGRGDFLIRNLLSADPNSGTITVGAQPKAGQTLQFQIRDPEAADEELLELLDKTKAELESSQSNPVAALLYSCNGRGLNLFETPHHDAQAINERLGAIPLAGFFCNGEIGPVGNNNFLHGYTASIALLLPSNS